eukprot:5420970-Amphidinium_carterae.1
MLCFILEWCFQFYVDVMGLVKLKAGVISALITAITSPPWETSGMAASSSFDLMSAARYCMPPQVCSKSDVFAVMLRCSAE